MQSRSTTAASVLLHSVLGVIGGVTYMGIEILWRGYTHWSMGVLGGLCFALIGLLDEWQDHPPMLLQMVQGAAIVTALELLVGLVVNRWLGWGVWDYSDMPFNLWGQVCLPFAAVWFFLSAVAVWVENALHRLAALVNDMAIAVTGRPLPQEGMHRFLADCAVDIGETGADVKTGLGAPILPDPETVDIWAYQTKEDIEMYKDDDKIPDWAREDVYYCREHGLMEGDTEGTFRPDDPVTRAELACTLARLHRRGR